MKELMFYGSFSNYFGEYGEFHLNCHALKSDQPIVYAVESENEGAGLLVFGQYDLCETGTWSISVSQLRFNEPLPLWPIEIRRCRGNENSVALSIAAPDDVRIKRQYFKVARRSK